MGCTRHRGEPTDLSILNYIFTVPPEVSVRHQRIGQKIGKNTILECRMKAFPQSRMYWTRGGKQIVTTVDKYRVEVYDEGKFTITLRLMIAKIQQEDFGEYTCHATNRLGEDEKTVILYGKS